MIDLNAIEQRANAASKPPWIVALGYVGRNHEWFLVRPDCDGIRAWTDQDHIDFWFAAHAREDIPALIARVRELEAADNEVSRASAALAERVRKLEAIIEATAREHECVAINADAWVATRDADETGKPWLVMRNTGAIADADTLWEAIEKGLADGNTKEPI